MLDRDDGIESKELQDLITVLYGEDELGSVVRGHIIVEAALNDLLRVLAPFPDHLKGGRTPYARNIDLALILGMPEDLASPLRVLGSIRNGFAHDIRAALLSERVNGLVSALSGRLMSTVRDQFNSIALAHDDFRVAGTFEKLSTRHKFQMLATSLWFALKEATWNAQVAQKKIQLAMLRSKSYEAGILGPYVPPSSA